MYTFSGGGHRVEHHPPRGALKRLQLCAYVFFERPQSKVSVFYHVFILLLIVVSLVLSVISTIGQMEKNAQLTKFTLIYEASLLLLFVMEYLLRVFGSKYVVRFQGVRGTVKFITTCYMLIDLFIIASTLTTLVLHMYKSYLSLLRVTRFMQIFRILRLDRQRGDLQTMGRVVFQHKKELVTCYFVGFVILFGGTYIVYIFERDNVEVGSIRNMADGLYWAMITVTSVGYGDFSPKTWPGKMVTGVFALLGCAFFSLPAGILGSGFALQVSKIKNKKRFTKKRHPAALLIQSWWRAYALNAEHLEASWFYMLPALSSPEQEQTQVKRMTVKRGSEPSPVLNQMLRTTKVNCSAESHLDHFFPAGLLTTKELKQARPQLEEKRKSMFEVVRLFSLPDIKVSKKDLLLPTTNSVQRCLVPQQAQKDRTIRKESFNGRGYSLRRKRTKSKTSYIDVDSMASKISNQIKTEYLHAVRFINKIRYLSSMRKFKTVRYPYVSIQDVVEKNCQNHYETMAYLNEVKVAVRYFRKDLEEVKSAVAESKLARERVTKLDSFVREELKGIRQELALQRQRSDIQEKMVAEQLTKILSEIKR